MQRKHISIYYLLSANHALDLLTINPEMQLTQFITLCVVSALAASCGHAAGIRVGRQSCTDVDNEQCQTNCAAQGWQQGWCYDPVYANISLPQLIIGY